MAEMRTVRCQECPTQFEVEARYIQRGGKKWETTQIKGRICPKCWDKKKKKWQQDRLKRESGAERVPFKERKLDEVAKNLGITFENARQIERRAMAKIRGNPELSRLFRDWMEDGGRITPGEPIKLVQQDVSGTLVDYMVELSNWYEIYGDLLGNGRMKEALECRREIERFHKTFKDHLIKLEVIK